MTFDTEQAFNRCLLHKRAIELARNETVDADSSDTMDVTVFRLGSEQYAFEASHVREVVPLKRVTALPCVPPYIAGVINMRGRILSLLDLRRLFGLAGESWSDESKVIILSDGSMEFGILADSIEGVQQVEPAILQEKLATIDAVKTNYLRGVTPEHLILLDAFKLLNDSELIVNDEIR